MSHNNGKGKKIHRRGPTVFHKNTRPKKVLKNIGLALFAMIIISGGFFAAEFILKDSSQNEGNATSVVGSASKTQPPGGATSTTTKTTAKQNPADPKGSLRAVFIPTARLTQIEGLKTFLEDASVAGFNAVLFDLKGEDGRIHYASDTPLAKQSKSIEKDALTPQQLKDIIKQLENKGFVAIPRLFAFRDPNSAFYLSTAKITVEGIPGYTWLDTSKKKGGKPWLNPYSPDAHSYIIEMAKELSDMGFSALMLDGVQFPNQTYSANYGNSDLRSLSWHEVLKKFMGDLSTAVGNGCRVIHTMPGLSAFSDGTEPFGGNPVTFGANTIAPILMPSTLGNSLKVGENTLTNPSDSPYDAVKLAAGQVELRLKLMEKRPYTMPWLQAYDYTDGQIKEQIKAVGEALGKDASYILYNSNGNYDFDKIA